METAPRRLTSKSGSSEAALLDAEYTEAPASLTTTLVKFSSGWSAISSPTSLSVSRLAVPFPIATSEAVCFFARFARISMEDCHSFLGSCGKIVPVSRTAPVSEITATFAPVRMPGSRPITALCPAGGASKRSLRLVPNTSMAASCEASRRREKRSLSSCQAHLTRQVQRTTLSSQASAGCPLFSRLRNSAIIVSHGCTG